MGTRMMMPLLAVLIAGIVPSASPTLAQGTATEVADIDAVAAAVRRAGYACTDPQTLSADQSHSTRDEPAWVIRCKEANYRVRFLGDAGTSVTNLD